MTQVSIASNLLSVLTVTPSPFLFPFLLLWLSFLSPRISLSCLFLSLSFPLCIPSPFCLPFSDPFPPPFPLLSLSLSRSLPFLSFSFLFLFPCDRIRAQGRPSKIATIPAPTRNSFAPETARNGCKNRLSYTDPRRQQMLPAKMRAKNTQSCVCATQTLASSTQSATTRTRTDDCCPSLSVTVPIASCPLGSPAGNSSVIRKYVTGVLFIVYIITLCHI